MAITEKAKNPVRSFNQETEVCLCRLTLANGANPTVNLNGGGVIASAARSDEGDWTVTLRPRFVKFEVFITIHSDTLTDTVQLASTNGITEGTNVTDAFRLLGAANGVASDLPDVVVGLLIVGIKRTENAT